MDENVVGRVIPIEKKTYEEMMMTSVNLLNLVCNLRSELKQCRNELCLKCGQYKEAHNGACDGCRYERGGEWEADINGSQH